MANGTKDYPAKSTGSESSTPQGMDLRWFLDIDWVKNQSTLADNLGLPLTNRFVCLLNAPKVGTFKSNGWLEIQVISVDCPNISIEPVEQELNGIKRYYFKGRNDGDLTITFLESPDLVLRRFFYEWMKLAVDIDVTKGVTRNYMSTYLASEVVVAPLDYSGVARYGDKFIKVFPTAIQEIAYNYTTNSDIIKTTVTFKYLAHTLVDVSSGDDGYHFTTAAQSVKENTWTSSRKTSY